jgi:hypothetical protein
MKQIPERESKTGRRSKQLLHDVTEKTGYWNKVEALDRSPWRRRNETGYAPVARPTPVLNESASDDIISANQWLLFRSESNVSGNCSGSFIWERSVPNDGERGGLWDA